MNEICICEHKKTNHDPNFTVYRGLHECLVCPCWNYKRDNLIYLEEKSFKTDCNIKVP